MKDDLFAIFIGIVIGIMISGVALGIIDTNTRNKLRQKFELEAIKNEKAEYFINNEMEKEFRWLPND